MSAITEIEPENEMEDDDVMYQLEQGENSVEYFKNSCILLN